MRRLVTFLFAAACVAGLAVACTDGPTESPTIQSPAFDWMNNPDNGNVMIYRYEDHWGWCWTDPKNGLRACHSTYPAASPNCGLQEWGDPIEFQELSHDLDNPFTNWIHRHAKGEVFIFVRDRNQPGDCFGGLLIAEGWGDYSYTDSDYDGVWEDEKHADAWLMRGHGVLATPVGDVVVYNGHWQGVMSNTQGLRDVSKVNVH